MADIIGTVYSPPRAGLPHLVVLLYKKDVLSARTCDSVAQGKAFLAKITPRVQVKINADKKKKKKKKAKR